MAAKSNTAFVLVPGSFSTPQMYDKLVSVLTSPPHSYSPAGFHRYTLPSTNHERPEGPASLQDDAAGLKDLIERLADQGLDVVVALSSYAGFVGTEASKDVSKPARAKAGKVGGVTALVYLAAFLPTIGQTPATITNAAPITDAPYMTLAGVMTPETIKGVFPDLPEEEAVAQLDNFTQHSKLSFTTPLTHEGYKDKDIKVFYLHVLQDFVLQTAWQKDWLETAKQSGVDIDVTVLDAGHVPMISKPKDVADLLIKAGTVGK